MKRTMVIITIAVMIVALMAGFSGCKKQPPAFSLDRTKTDVNVGGNAVITITATDTNGAADTISAVSKDETVATAEAGDSTVTITGVARGSTYVEISTGSGLDEMVEVSVVPMVNSTTVTMLLGYQYKLTVNPIGTDGQETTAAVSSSDETIVKAEAATAGDGFVLTPQAAGSATVTVTSAGGASDALAVTVSGDISCSGTWESSWGEEWIITNSSIEYDDGWGGGWKGSLVEYKNGSFNAGDTTIAANRTIPDTQTGFAVIKFTEVSNAGWGEVDKFMVFRWCRSVSSPVSSPSKNDFSLGYKNVGSAYPNNVNGVFDTAAEAKTGATNAAGYFAFASTDIEKQ